MKVLECSTVGYRPLSAFCAVVYVFGKYATVEEHYQLSKRFDGVAPEKVPDCKGRHARFKGRMVTSVAVQGVEFPPEMLTPWYYMLWLIYLDSNPELVKYASQFDDFSDRFSGKSINCQADVVRMYVKQGREAVMQVVAPLLLELRDNGKL